MTVTMRFACGHRVVLETLPETAPACPECAERRVAYVCAPPPRFVATNCGGRPMGPHVTHG